MRAYNTQAIKYTTGTETVRTFADRNTHTGTPLERSFCRVCGSPVAIQTALQPGRVFIPAGALDDTSLQDQVPLSENFVDARVAWIGKVAEKRMAGRKKA